MNLNEGCRTLIGSTVCSNRAKGGVGTHPSPTCDCAISEALNVYLIILSKGLQTSEHQLTVAWEVLEEGWNSPARKDNLDSTQKLKWADNMVPSIPPPKEQGWWTLLWRHVPCDSQLMLYSSPETSLLKQWKEPWM